MSIKEELIGAELVNRNTDEEAQGINQNVDEEVAKVLASLGILAKQETLLEILRGVRSARNTSLFELGKTKVKTIKVTGSQNARVSASLSGKNRIKAVTVYYQSGGSTVKLSYPTITVDGTTYALNADANNILSVSAGTWGLLMITTGNNIETENPFFAFNSNTVKWDTFLVTCDVENSFEISGDLNIAATFFFGFIYEPIE